MAAKQMRLFLYKFLTQFIIILSILRSKLDLRRGIFKDRTYIDPRELIEYPSFGIIFECCDCGLSHRQWIQNGNLYSQPERPLNYDYSWRVLGGAASKHEPEETAVGQD